MYTVTMVEHSNTQRTNKQRLVIEAATLDTGKQIRFPNVICLNSKLRVITSNRRGRARTARDRGSNARHWQINPFSRTRFV